MKRKFTINMVLAIIFVMPLFAYTMGGMEINKYIVGICTLISSVFAFAMIFSTNNENSK